MAEIMSHYEAYRGNGQKRYSFFHGEALARLLRPSTRSLVLTAQLLCRVVGGLVPHVLPFTRRECL